MSYIFVGGSQRSGTSMLAAAMCAGEETNQYIGESGALFQLMHAHSYMERRFDVEMAFHFGSKASMREYMRTSVLTFLSHVLNTNAPAKSLILKEPHLTMHFPLLWTLLPESRFVIMVRDPRDVICSMLTVGEKFKAQGQNHLFASGDIDQMAGSIANFYRPTLLKMQKSEDFSDSVMWVKYENLVRDPLKEMERVREFTGLKIEQFDPENPTKRTHPAKVKSRKSNKKATPWISPLMHGKPVSESSMAKYKTMLDPEQIKIIQEKLPGLFQRFKYQLEDV